MRKLSSELERIYTAQIKERFLELGLIDQEVSVNFDEAVGEGHSYKLLSGDYIEELSGVTIQDSSGKTLFENVWVDIAYSKSISEPLVFIEYIELDDATLLQTRDILPSNFLKKYLTSQQLTELYEQKYFSEYRHDRLFAKRLSNMEKNLLAEIDIKFPKFQITFPDRTYYYDNDKNLLMYVVISDFAHYYEKCFELGEKSTVESINSYILNLYQTNNALKNLVIVGFLESLRPRSSIYHNIKNNLPTELKCALEDLDKFFTTGK